MATRIVNTHEAKSRLSELIREAEQGVEIIVARNGQPVARIVPWTTPTVQREPGAWADLVEPGFGDDHVGPDPDVTALFDESVGAEPS